MKHVTLVSLFLLCCVFVFGAGQQSEESVSGEPKTLTFFTKTDLKMGVDNRDEALCWQIIQENLGIDIIWQHPVDAGPEFTLMLASGDITDLISDSWGSYSGGVAKGYEDGIVVDLSDKLNKLPNLAKLFTEVPRLKKEMYNDDGRLLGVLPYEQAVERPWRGFFIRQDWLDNVGMEIPSTIDDWHAVLSAFKKADLNGTGGVVFSGRKSNEESLWGFAPAWGVRKATVSLDPATGKVIYPKIDPRFKEFLETMIQWDAEGLIDAQHIFGDKAQYKADIINGAVGSGICATSQFTEFNMSGQDLDPDFFTEAAPYPIGPAGRRFVMMDFDRIVDAGVRVVITTACDDLDSALRLVDYGYTEEASLLLNWGVEGVSYKINEKGEKEFLVKDPAEIYKYTHADLRTPRIVDMDAAMGWYTDFQKEQTEVWKKDADYSIHLPATLYFTDEESQVIKRIRSDLDTYTDETLAKMLLGEYSLDMWDEYVAQAEKMGVDELVAVYQAAVDRYKKR